MSRKRAARTDVHPFMRAIGRRSTGHRRRRFHAGGPPTYRPPVLAGAPAAGVAGAAGARAPLTTVAVIAMNGSASAYWL
jgi:hypothetical protein